MEALPHDLPLEKAALAAILLDPSRAVEAVELAPTTFYAESHRLIFHALVACLASHKDDRGRPTVDLYLLRRELQDAGTLERAGGVAALAALVDGHSRSANLPAYVRTLRDLEAKRDAVTGAEQIAAAARKEHVADVRAVLEQVAQRLRSKDTTEIRRLDLRHILEGDDDPIPWIVDGWLGAGDLCFLAGEWGTGKSLIALDLAISLSCGLPWLGRMGTTKPGPILYLDEENNPRSAIRRLRRMLRGRNIDPTEAAQLPIHYLHQNGLNLDSRESKALLNKEIDRVKPVAIVLDSLIRFHRRDENKNSAMSAFFEDALRPICREGVSVVCLDHMRKPGEHDKDSDTAHRLRGAGDKAGVADTIWTLSGKRDETTRTLECRKVRWEDSLPPQMQTKWETSEDETAAWISVSDAQLNAEVVILSVVADAGSAGIYATDLFEQSERRGIPRSTVIRTTKRLRHAGAIEYRQEGKRVRYWAKGTVLSVAL